MSVPTPTAFLTLTGNLLAERTLEFSSWAAGRTQRAQRESFQVGGKGINVAKMLARLGQPATALCFAGGSTGGDAREWLGRQTFASRVFPTVNATRIGIVVRGGDTPETTFFSPDVQPDAAAVRACAEFLDAQAPGTVLAVCGSVPGWSSPDFDPLRAALQRWTKRGTLVGDSYGPPLEWLSQQPLELLKINAAELRTLFPTDAARTPTAELLKLISHRSPVRRWIVTDGAAPVWFQEGQNPSASVTPPRVGEISATGSGDVLLACVLDRLFRQRLPLSEAIAQALPYAAANAAHPGVADFPLP